MVAEAAVAAKGKLVQGMSAASEEMQGTDGRKRVLLRTPTQHSPWCAQREMAVETQGTDAPILKDGYVFAIVHVSKSSNTKVRMTCKFLTGRSGDRLIHTHTRSPLPSCSHTEGWLISVLFCRLCLSMTHALSSAMERHHNMY